MPSNTPIIEKLLELTHWIKLSQNYNTNQKEITANEFRIRAIQYLINVLKKHKVEDLKGIPKIGKGSLEKVDEILKTGTLQEINDLKKKYQKYEKMNKIIEELVEVVGIGEVKARELIEEYDIKSVKDLKDRHKRGEIELNEKIQIGLKYHGKFKGSIPRKEVDAIADQIEKTLKNNNLTVTFCGSYRRGSSYPNDIDVLLCSLSLKEEPSLLKESIKKLKQVGLIIDDIAGEESGTKYMGFCQYKNNPVRRIDIRVIPLESYYTAILYFTGSYELNKVMRQKAKQLGYKLNEYGLYKGNTALDVGSEEDVFRYLEMEYLPPEER